MQKQFTDQRGIFSKLTKGCSRNRIKENHNKTGTYTLTAFVNNVRYREIVFLVRIQWLSLERPD